MKYSLFLFLSLHSLQAFSQQNKIMCGPACTERFAMLGADKSFNATHQAPLPFLYTTGTGKMITFPTTDGKDANAYEVKIGKESNKVLFVFQEYWGLNDYIKKEAEKLGTELGDITVYAIDLYDGKVASTADEAGKYMGEAKEERLKTIITGAIAKAGKNAKIYTIGWCFGGGWSMQASLLAGTQAAGCVMYYGMPESDVNKLKNLHADVLGLFATQDKWITPAVVSTFEANMKANGKKLTVKSYDAVHAFANPSNPQKFNKEAAEDAHKQSIAFFKEHMK
jgi:carboxymethylenebutenolidase